MKNIKTNALTNMLVKILNIVFPLITGPYISRILSKAEYGNFNVANTFLNLFIPIATLGIYNYGIREISKIKDDKDKINKKFSELFFISFCSTAITMAVYYSYVIFFADLGDLEYMYKIMGIQIFAQLFYIEWVNEAFEDYKFILYKSLFVRIAMFVLIFTFVKEPEDIIPYTMIMTFITLLNYVLSFIWIKRYIKFVKIDISKLKPLLPPIFAVLLIANANMLYTYLDQIFLVKSGIVENVTYYILGFNLVTIIARVVSGAVSVSVPRLGYYLGLKKFKEYEDLVNKTSRVFFFFLAPICMGLFVLGTPVTLLYGGEKYFFAGLCTMLFAIRTIGWGLEIIFGTQVILVRGYEQNLTVLYFIGGGINLLLNLLLYLNGYNNPEYYIITTMIAEISLLILEYLFIIRENLINPSQIIKNIIKYTILSLPFIPISYIVSKIYEITAKVDGNLLKNIQFTMIFCIIYYAIIMYITKDEIFDAVLFGIKKKLKIK